jgi:hypothetical protein
MILRIPLAFFSALAACVSITAAWTAQTGASRFALAQVTDPRGKPLVDNGVDDFVVQEGGAERELLDVRVADYPVVLVVDNTGDDFATMRGAAARFLTRLGPRPVTIVATTPPTTIAAFEEEREAVMGQLEALTADASARSQPLHALSLAGEAIKRTGTLFATIVVATSSPVEAIEGDTAELLAPVIDSRSVVHVVANAARTDRGDRALRDLAAQTHGDYSPIYTAASYPPAFDRLASRLTTEMLIEYIVPVGSRPADVKIGVRLPGARVRGLGVAPR